MSDDLPEEYDLVVIGTGLSESILAAGASRIGKTVLHLDENEFYGNVWSSFGLENLLQFLEAPNTPLTNIQQEWFDFTTDTPEVNGWDKEKILKENRRFNIDLIPKMVFSNGKLVDLLISSNICRYSEFRAADKILTFQNQKLIVVPCSRSDVFTSKSVNVVEKRLLMKFLNNCLEYNKKSSGEDSAEPEKHDFEGFPDDGKFVELLKQQKIPTNLTHFILYSICMGDEGTSFKEAMEKIQITLSSIGKYGNTPFLFPMYGCGEIPQCFCRLCAVFGGIYCLGRKISDIQIQEDTKKISLKVGEQKISTRFLLEGFGTKKDSKEQLSRGVFVTSTPIGGDEINSDKDGGGVIFMKMPPIENVNGNGALLIQLAHFSGTIPKGLYLVHLTTPKIQDAKADLQPFVDLLFKKSLDPEANSTMPVILYSLFFNIPCSTKESFKVDSQEGPIYSSCGPFFEVDYDETLEQSHQLFKKMFPDEEYLPRAPDPEEIIMGDDNDGGDNLGNINLGVLADIIQDSEKIDVVERAKEENDVGVEATEIDGGKETETVGVEATEAPKSEESNDAKNPEEST